MDMKELTSTAATLIKGISYSERQKNGTEVAPGWFIVYNTSTGQSRTVVHHLESGYCFKRFNDEESERTASGNFLGTVEWLGKIFSIRLPNYFVDYNADIIAQEFVTGTSCPCDKDLNFCEHTKDMSRATGFSDTHRGNWLISGDEIVLFDFEI